MRIKPAGIASDRPRVPEACVEIPTSVYTRRLSYRAIPISIDDGEAAVR